MCSETDFSFIIAFRFLKALPYFIGEIVAASGVTTLPDGPIFDGQLYGSMAPYAINGPRVHEFLQEMHREVFAGVDRPLLLVGETPGVSPEDAIRFSDPSRDELDMVFQFEHMFLDYGAGKWDQRPLDLVALKRTLGRWQEGLAERGWNSLYWDNHDQPRIVSRWGEDGEHRVRSAKLLATILHLQRGTPYIYQGEELGMTNSVFSSIDDFRDLESLNHYKEATANGEDPAAVLAGLSGWHLERGWGPLRAVRLRG